MAASDGFSPRAPTDRQLDLIRRLLEERDCLDQPAPGSFEDASELIGALLDGSYPQRARRWHCDHGWRNHPPF